MIFMVKIPVRRQSNMAEKKQWYKYTDEAGRCWRLKLTPALAEIGGLQVCDESSFRHLPDSVEVRYMWIIEKERPEDRLPARHKVILESGRFKEIVHAKPFPTWELAGREFGMLSYYGETTYADT